MSRIFEIITPAASRTFSEADLPLAVGTGARAAIPLPAGAETAAWLAESRGYLFLQAETGSAVYHNNEHLEGSVWIKSGDTTRIGTSLIHWNIVGDRVEIRVEKATGTAALLRPPPAPPHDLSSSQPLPRVENRTRKAGIGRRMLFPVLGLFVLLVMAVFFLLTASRVQVVVQPHPDQLRLAGFPPAIPIGDTFLCVNGSYRVLAEKAGYRPLAARIAVQAGKNHFSFNLKKLPGRVTFISTPVDGATIFVDNRAVGKTPLAAVELAAGKHLLRVQKERYLSLEETLLVTGEGRKQEVSLRLKPGWARVSFTSDPAGAMVILEEKRLGTTPLTVEVPAGQRQFLFSRKEYLDTELELEITPGAVLAPEPVRLAPAPAVVHVDSVPPGATVVIGGTFFGKTPVTIKTAPNTTQEIRLQLAGYRPVVIKKRFGPAGEHKISTTLTPRYGTVFLTTDPVDAVLFIDGRKYGPATGPLRLIVKEHRLTVRADGFVSESRQVVPGEKTGRRLFIRLRRQEEKKALSRAAPGVGDNGMVRLGPAVVLMGAPRREPGRRANEQQRLVRLTKSYLIAAHLVTNGEFRRFQPGHRSGNIGSMTLDGDKQPVVNVSWQDAARYCNWLSRKEGLPEFYQKNGKTMAAVSPANSGYRLPTEAEWSYAARQAGRSRRARYPWAGKFPPATVVGNFGDESARSLLPVVISGYNDSFAVTSPVAVFPKNPGGLYDMGGNVRQWCHDWYGAYAGLGEQKETIDSMGPASGTHHVVRGSSWRQATMTSLRLSYRGYSKVGKDDIGFRVARYLK